MKTTNPDRHSKESSLSGNSLQIKIIASKKDVALCTKLAKQFHYMGEGCPAGDTLRRVVMADEFEKGAASDADGIMPIKAAQKMR